MDICTVFEMKGIDPDISREDYCEIETFREEKTKVLHEDFKSIKHNALWDAFIIRECYNKLTIF